MTSPEHQEHDSNENVEVVEIVVEKVKQTRRIRAPHRHRPDGTYDNSPISPTYWRDYRRATKSPCECPYCHSTFGHEDNLGKHYRTAKQCKKLREALAGETETPELNVEEATEEETLEIPETPQLDVEEATEEEISAELQKAFAQKNPLAVMALLSVLSKMKGLW